MAITDWPKDERPREKLVNHGAASLTDAELLAIFLRTGTRGRTALDLAISLLNRFGGLRPLFAASEQEFSQTPGLGRAKYAQLQAIKEIAHRHQHERIARQEVLSNPNETRCYLQLRLEHYPYEVFACLFLDNRHRIICYRELFRGTIDGASVYPREVIRYVMKYNAAAVIFAHNHPSGVAEPSQADRTITRRLKEALDYLDVRVLDHVIVGHQETVSLAERGLL